MSYSPVLSYFLDNLNGYSTNVFKLQGQGVPQTATANQILRFTLPANSLLNMRSFAVHFKAITEGTTAGARLPAKIDSLVERVEVTVGGVQLSAGSNYYNVLCHAKQALMGSKTDPVLGHPEIVRDRKYVDNGAITTTGNETYSSSKAMFAINKWEGFLGSCEPKVIDSGLLPDIVVSISLASNSVCTSSAGVGLEGAGATDITDAGSLNATYTLSDIYATIECLNLMDGTYDNMVSTMIQQRGFLEVPFKNYIAFRDNTASSMRFSVATASLDRIWVAHHVANHTTQAAPVTVTGYLTNTTGANYVPLHGAKEKYLGNRFNFSEATTDSTYQFSLNGALLPQFQGSFEDMMQISENSVLGPPQKDHGLHTMKNHYAVFCARLNLPESEYSRVISGMDTRGVSLNGFYNIYGNTANRDITLFAECSSILRIGQGQQLEVIM